MECLPANSYLKSPSELLTEHFAVFYVHVTVHLNKFLYNKTNRRTNIPNLFWYETLHVSGSSSAYHQELSTVHAALAHVIHV